MYCTVPEISGWTAAPHLVLTQVRFDTVIPFSTQIFLTCLFLLINTDVRKDCGC